MSAATLRAEHKAAPRNLWPLAMRRSTTEPGEQALNSSKILRALSKSTLVLASALLTASAFSNPAPLASPDEVLICTTLYKGSAEPGQPLLPGNPLGQLASLPTSCTGSSVSSLEQRDGIRALLSLNWKPLSVSHQVTVLSLARGPSERSDLLVSMIVILQRHVQTAGSAR